MKRKLVHVLGGGHWQLPTIRLARSLGYRVLVTDKYPQRPAYALADEREVIDIADREATLDAARRHRIDGITCDTTDAGVPTAAYVAERLGLAGIGYEVALNFTNKHRMRTITAAAGLSPVRFRLVSKFAELRAAAEEIGYPLVIKPVDNQSSRGVHRIDDPTELDEGFSGARRATRERGVLLEEFLPGIEATVEGICLAGRYRTTACSDKGHFAHRPEVANRLTYPAAFDQATTARLLAANEAVVRSLGMTNGVTHSEFMVLDGEVRLIEIAARGGGNRIHTDIVPRLSGIDAPRSYLDFVMNAGPTPASPARAKAANLAFFDFPAGRVSAIRGVEEARRIVGVHEIFLEFAAGDALRPPHDDRSRPGFVLAFGADRDDVVATTEKAMRTVEVDVEGFSHAAV
ncbi:MAG TPA: ATP-grasp domain-containing protein [Pirellulales bacterium]|nr:ATP-grasp domain-containing protein [Pirellulales bacterium]